MKTPLAVLYDFLFIISRFKVTSSSCTKEEIKKHFDNLLHVLYQRVRPQKQPAVCLRIFQIKTTFL